MKTNKIQKWVDDWYDMYKEFIEEVHKASGFGF